MSKIFVIEVSCMNQMGSAKSVSLEACYEEAITGRLMQLHLEPDVCSYTVFEAGLPDSEDKSNEVKIAARWTRLSVDRDKLLLKSNAD